MLEVRSLTKFYGSRCAVDSISFTAGEGEVVGLLGLNGAGKSTTMNIIAGCLSSTSGAVLVGGINVEDEPEAAKKNIGCLPEQPPLYGEMKVSEYLDFVCELKGVVKSKRKDEADRVCELAGLSGKEGTEDRRRQLIRSLSKGYRQRVGIAQALAGNPPVLIFDEPTVGLDPAQIIEVRALISELGKNRLVLLSSHILSEVEAVCTRALVINKGVLAADMKLGKDENEDDGAANKPSLESVFLNIVKTEGGAPEPAAEPTAEAEK